MTSLTKAVMQAVRVMPLNKGAVPVVRMKGLMKASCPLFHLLSPPALLRFLTAGCVTGVETEPDDGEVHDDVYWGTRTIRAQIIEILSKNSTCLLPPSRSTQSFHA